VIVDPDFLDHWRTGMVISTLKDPFAPFYILRIWGHCQHRKKDRFEGMPAEGLASLCKYQGEDPAALEAALVKSKFIAREGDDILVLDWAEKNASLLAAWENGKLGGRPPKPRGNPEETHGEPRANRIETDIDREIDISTSLRSVEKPRKRGARTCPEDFDVTDEMILWAAKEAPFADLDRETAKFRDWEFKDSKTDWPRAWRRWMRKASDDASKARAQPPPAETFRERDQRIAAERVAQLGGGVAAKPKQEVIDVFARRLDREDLRQDDRDLRIGMDSDVGRG
jgi:hypothetical protein